MKYSVALLGTVCTVAGCATQDQLRQTEVQQGQAVQALKADASRSDSVMAELRAEIKRVQEYVHGLEVVLTEARARTDAAKAQADSALLTSREFLANLLAAREEQRRQLDENGVAFADLRRKAADLDSRLQAHQQLIDQRNVVFTEATRRLTAVEAGLQEAGRRSTMLESQATVGRETANGLATQLATLKQQVEETRAVINSKGLLQLMRDLEDVRRGTAALRGAIDELQKAQSDSAAAAKSFYLDLDRRIQALSKAQADLATQDKSLHFDLDNRIQALNRVQADSVTQDTKAYLDLDARIQALIKVQADFATQEKNFHLDLDTRVQALKKAQADLAAQDKDLHLDLEMRIQDLKKAQADFAAQARNLYIDFDTRIEALKLKLPAAASERAVAPAAEPARPVTQ